MTDRMLEHTDTSGFLMLKLAKSCWNYVGSPIDIGGPSIGDGILFWYPEETS